MKIIYKASFVSGAALGSRPFNPYNVLIMEPSLAGPQVLNCVVLMAGLEPARFYSGRF